MDILLNGAGTTVHQGITVKKLLEDKRIKPATIIVEINDVIIHRNAYADTKLAAGDRIELISYMGGG